MKEHRCKRCGVVWWSPVEEPVVCKGCGSRLWNKERERGIGGGRPRGAVRKQKIKERGDHIGDGAEMVEGGRDGAIPEGWVLAVDVAREAGVTEGDVWTRALTMQERSKARRLPGGMRVVSREWVEERKKVGAKGGER